jgi:HAD superfamily hydrolase (TIGR01509 family)
MQVCREFGMEVSQNEWDNFRGRKLEDIFSYASHKYGTGQEPIEKMIERKIEVYLACALKDLQLIDGALEFLESLKKDPRYRLALTTSGRKFQQDQILAKFGLARFFEIIVTADDVSNGKPHPDPYLVTVEKLGELPGACLVIEDSDNGILSAKAAGCQVCAITTTFGQDKLKKAGADMIVSAFSELEKIIK